MSQFQANIATKEGTFKIIQTLNKALDNSQMIGSELDEIFEVWWPKLEEKFVEVPEIEKESVLQRSTENILEEILSNSREQMRREEIRLKSFEKREHDLDSLTKNMEGFLEMIRQGSLKLMNSKNEFESILNKAEGEAEKPEIPKKIKQILENKDVGSFFDSLSNSAGPMVDMVGKLKSMQNDSQEMNDMILNPDKRNKTEGGSEDKP